MRRLTNSFLRIEQHIKPTDCYTRHWEGKSWDVAVLSRYFGGRAQNFDSVSYQLALIINLVRVPVPNTPHTQATASERPLTELELYYVSITHATGTIWLAMRTSSWHIYCHKIYKSCNKIPGTIKSTHHLNFYIDIWYVPMMRDNIWWRAPYCQVFMPCTINVRGPKEGHSMHDSAWIAREIHENNRYQPRSCMDVERQLHTAWYVGVLLGGFHLVKRALLPRSRDYEILFALSTVLRQLS